MTVETAAHLRRRIELAEELRSVTGTMKSLAAVSLHHYERSMHTIHEYVTTAELGLQILVRARPEAIFDDAAAADDPRTLIVVFGSARGLCGPLNRHIARHARQAVDDLDAAHDDARKPAVLASGQRLIAELEAVDLAPDDLVDAPASVEGLTPLVEDLLVRIDEWRRAAPGSARVLLMHPRPVAGTSRYETATVPLVPIDVARLHDLAAAEWPTRVLPTWHGSWTEVFAALTRELLFVDLHRALAETQVCVHRARLAAMQGAEDTIGEQLEQLWSRLHRQRQATITEELLDVISGFEAAGGPGRPAR